MSRPRMLDDWQWDKIKPYLPVKEASRKGGRPRVGDRECLEGILWLLKTGARWRDLPDGFPSASTCWRRLVEWEEEGVLDDLWIAFLDTLDEQGTLRWNEVFLDATFFPAKKGGDHVGPTKRGKGTKLVLVADGQGLPVACRIASASPAEVTLARGTLDKVRRPKAKRVIPVVADRAYDSDTLRHQLRPSGWDLVCPHRRGRVRRPTQDGRKLRRYRRRWKIESTFSWLGSYRRLLVRHEFYSLVFVAFIKLTCLLILLKRF